MKNFVIIIFLIFITSSACVSRFTTRLKEKIEEETYKENIYQGTSIGSDPHLKSLFFSISNVVLEQNDNKDWQFRIRFHSDPEKSLCILISRNVTLEKVLNTKKEHYIRYEESGREYPNLTILDWEKRKDINNLIRIQNESLQPCNEESFKDTLKLESITLKKALFPHAVEEVIFPTALENQFHFLGKYLPYSAGITREKEKVPVVFSYQWDEPSKSFAFSGSEEKFVFPYVGDRDPHKLNFRYAERTRGKKVKIHFYLGLLDEERTYFFYVLQKNDVIYKPHLIPPLVVLEDFDRIVIPAPPPKRKTAKFLNAFLPFTILADIVTYPYQIVDCLSEYNWSRPARKECQ